LYLVVMLPPAQSDYGLASWQIADRYAARLNHWNGCAISDRNCNNYRDHSVLLGEWCEQCLASNLFITYIFSLFACKRALENWYNLDWLQTETDTGSGDVLVSL